MLMTIQELANTGDDFELLRAIFYSIDIPYAVVGIDGVPVRVNRAIERFLEYSETELKKLHFTDITFTADRDLDSQMFEELVKGQREGYLVIKRWLTKPGSVVWGALSCSAIRNPNGDIVAIVATINPIEPSGTAASAIRYMGDTDRARVKSELGVIADSSPRSWVVDIIAAFESMQSPVKVGFAVFLIMLGFWLFSSGGAERLIEVLHHPITP